MRRSPLCPAGMPRCRSLLAVVVVSLLVPFCLAAPATGAGSGEGNADAASLDEPLLAAVARAAVDAASQQRQFCEDTLHGELWQRTELYFGLSRADGPDVSEDEFEDFLDRQVTPRFPDGLTLLSGHGQYRGSDGQVIEEGSKLLILFYPWSGSASRKIERIRELYKARFHQEAVLRVDASSCVSF